jgi:protein phosphatase
MRLWGATATHVGNVREVNQDRVYFRGSVAALADGMGGHQGGERAAELAIGEFRIVRAQLTQAELVDVVEEANRQVHHQAADPNLRGMGTTMVALGLHKDDSITVTNVGDSRAYWLRGDYLAQITDDHSFVEDLVRQGRLSPEEATIHPQRNILTRALGIADEVLVDRFDLDPDVGDRFLLCSDGLFNEVSIDEITRILLDNPDPGPAAEALVAAALATPCRDNVTVAVVNVVEDDHPAVIDETDMGIDLTPPEKITDQFPIVAPGVSKITDRPDDTGGHVNGNHPVAIDDRHVATRVDEYADEPDMAGGATTTYDITHLVQTGARPPTLMDHEAEGGYVEDDDPVPVASRSRVLRRVLAVAAVVAVVAGAYFGGRAYNRSFYHVEVIDGELVIFNGREDGLFFFGRELEERTMLFYEDLTEASQTTVDSWGNFGSFKETQLSVDNLDVRSATEQADQRAEASDNANTTSTDSGGNSSSQGG